MSTETIKSQKIRWTDVTEGARDSLFRVWTDARELLWAEKSWGFLEKHGLTTYSSEVSKVPVLVRLMSLAEIYREFCDRAWDEQHDCELVDWASEIDLNRFRLAQYVGSKFEESTCDDEEELLSSALMSLAEEARAGIYHVLVEEFGSESYLFVSLWNTVEFRRKDDEPESYFEDDDPDQSEEETMQQQLVLNREKPEQTEIHWLKDAETILSAVTSDKMSAYEWIEGGIPRVR
jgi:hypothetical protein